MCNMIDFLATIIIHLVDFMLCNFFFGGGEPVLLALTNYIIICGGRL